MKFFLVAFLIATLVALATAADLKSIIVSFDKDTAEKKIEDCKNDITSAGGIITHVYTLIKGFSAQVPESYLSTVKTMSKDEGFAVEEDQQVSINGRDS